MRRLSFLVCCVGLSGSAVADFTTVDLSGIYNENRNFTFGGGTFPSGPKVYSSIPFQFGAASGNDFYNSNHDHLPGNIILDVPVQQERTQKVHTILSTLWGTSTPNLISLEFFGLNGAYYKEDWGGFDQIRSISKGIFLNSTSSPNTHEVHYEFVNNDMQFWHDRQEITLPTAFLTDTLINFRITDKGAEGLQRTAFMALTLESAPPPVPEPASVLVLTLGGLLLKRRRGKQ